MAVDIEKRAENAKGNTIFLSWSGEYSKEIARQLKDTIEELFEGKIICFFSEVDIPSGEEWYRKIHIELQKSAMGIMCITKENVKAPWLYFEAGALVGNNVKIVPLLVNCDQNSLKNSPITANQSVQLYRQDKFRKMLFDIRKEFELFQDRSNKMLSAAFDNSYVQLKEKLKPVLDELKRKRFFSERYIFPNDVHTVTMDTMYISAPMDSLSEEEYKEQYEFLIKLKRSLKEKLGFKDVFSPALEIKPGKKWQGITTSVKRNFKQLRQIENLIVIYPAKIPSSVLVEIGYCIALSKNTVIFYREDLPFMLRGAGEDIVHLHTRHSTDFSDILEVLETDGRSLFEVTEDD